jgi:hypothetical protein
MSTLIFLNTLLRRFFFKSAFLAVCFFWLIGCSATKTSTVNHDKSADQPEIKTLPAPKKVMVLGNSITDHGPSPAIGWHGDWGMAASAREKDFVHVLMDSLRKSYDTVTWDFLYRNISFWERNLGYDFVRERTFEKLLTYDPDILIIRLGENVNEDSARNKNYELKLTELINTFKGKKSAVIITGNFWPSKYKDDVQRNVAVKNNYFFVDLSALSNDTRNQAADYFEHPGVAAHPSDYGMSNIANKILEVINAEALVDQ